MKTQRNQEYKNNSNIILRNAKYNFKILKCNISPVQSKSTVHNGSIQIILYMNMLQYIYRNDLCNNV